jgi:ATP-dependent exoDNAse (exonuclease V) beta subunit
MVTFTTKANKSQKETISQTENPLLIVAGSGSEKTFTSVEQIVFLITGKQILPERIFVVTFTEKAAGELRTRISNRLSTVDLKFNLNEMYLGTFHSIIKLFDVESLGNKRFPDQQKIKVSKPLLSEVFKVTRKYIKENKLKPRDV